MSLALLVALDLDRRPTPWRAVLLGVLVGLGHADAQRARAAGGRLRRAGVVAGGGRAAAVARSRCSCSAATAVTLLPWVVYNAGRFERTVLLSTNDGTTLLGANCPQTYYDDVGGWDIRCLGPVPNDDTIDASVRSAERRDVAVDYVRDHLGRVPVVVAARVGRALDVYGLASLVALDRGEEKADWAVWAGIVCWWVLADRRRSSAGGALGRDEATRRSRWWLAVPVLTVLVTTIAVLRRPPDPGPGRAGRRAPRRRRPRVDRRGIGFGRRRVAHSPA